VKAGQLLATITSPEIDQHCSKPARAARKVVANVALAEARVKRIKDVATSGAVSAQELDDAQAVYNSQLAAQRVSEAVVSRLETEQSYQKVVAPFDGVVTRRNIDRGSLITAGSGTSVSSLFELQQQTTMRVFVDVPQSWAMTIAPGTPAVVELREFPNEQFHAKVVRTSGALETSTRTLRTELHLPNADGRLMPGMYAQVKLSPANGHPPLVVPANTLVIDGAGVQVVTVGMTTASRARRSGSVGISGGRSKSSAASRQPLDWSSARATICAPVKRSRLLTRTNQPLRRVEARRARARRRSRINYFPPVVAMP
jgi:RND family efflux transporter MFP subunit